MTHLEITQVLLVHCKFANNNYQQDSRVLYKFIPYKPFGQLIDISPKNFTFKKASTSEFSYSEILLTDQFLNC